MSGRLAPTVALVERGCMVRSPPVVRHRSFRGSHTPRREVRAADLQGSRRYASRTGLISPHERFVGSDEDGDSPANIAASEASH
jgi:hypothetical protein